MVLVMTEQGFGIRPLLPASLIDPRTKISIEVTVGVVVCGAYAYITGPTGFFSYQISQLEDFKGDRVQITSHRYGGSLDVLMDVPLLRDAVMSLQEDAALEEQRAKLKKIDPDGRRFCKYGHDTNAFGRDKWGKCRECRRERARGYRRNDREVAAP